jgi:hypothetical protein
MKPTYEVRTNSDGEEIIIQTNPDGTIWSFLSDPMNPDFQRYLKRDEAEQSTPIVEVE